MLPVFWYSPSLQTQNSHDIQVIKNIKFTKPPKNAIVLFDGKDTSHWIHRGSGEPLKWDVHDGYLEVKPGTPDIVTKEEFGDYKLHVEFWLPLQSELKDQARSNSGIYNQGKYEIQILDCYNNSTYKFGGIGAIYGQKDPDKNAIIPPENWNTYDITFRGARLDNIGNIREKPVVTVDHNGIRIHTRVVLESKNTAAGLDKIALDRGPILIQNHGSKIRFRNIWLVKLNLKKP